jgi:hypothetical protein
MLCTASQKLRNFLEKIKELDKYFPRIGHLRRFIIMDDMYLLSEGQRIRDCQCHIEYIRRKRPAGATEKGVIDV